MPRNGTCVNFTLELFCQASLMMCEMVPVPGLKLEVYGTLNCEYFYKPDIYDVAGTLPVGRYEAVAQSVGCYGGFTWVTLRYKNAVYWTALLADRCFLLRA